MIYHNLTLSHKSVTVMIRPDPADAPSRQHLQEQGHLHRADQIQHLTWRTQFSSQFHENNLGILFCSHHQI